MSSDKGLPHLPENEVDPELLRKRRQLFSAAEQSLAFQSCDGPLYAPPRDGNWSSWKREAHGWMARAVVAEQSLNNLEKFLKQNFPKFNPDHDEPALKAIQLLTLTKEFIENIMPMVWRNVIGPYLQAMLSTGLITEEDVERIRRG